MTVELWHVPDCPLTEQVRSVVLECLKHSGIDMPVTERSGSFPSPTLVINGVDVATGTTPSSGAYCRLDLPTHDQIHTALASLVRGSP